MKSLRTELNVSGDSFNIDLSDKVFAIGSCFSNTIATFLIDNKFQASDPFGALYSPVAICNSLAMASLNSEPSESSYVENHGLWSNYDFHSSFSSETKSKTKDKIASVVNRAHNDITKAKYVIITFGTAWAFERRDAKTFVANCHKLPAGNFEKKLLTVASVVESFDKMIAILRSANSDVRIILAISPVRHLKDTLQLNSVSKAVLRVAAHQIASTFRNTDYFPSYEIMMDDLRDYRFYDDDMLHPSRLAISYITEKFAQKYFTDETRDFIRVWSSVRSAMQHRPFYPSGMAYKAFLADTLSKLKELKATVCVDNEINQLQQRLASAGS